MKRNIARVAINRQEPPTRISEPETDRQGEDLIERQGRDHDGRWLPAASCGPTRRALLDIATRSGCEATWPFRGTGRAASILQDREIVRRDWNIRARPFPPRRAQQGRKRDGRSRVNFGTAFLFAIARRIDYHALCAQESPGAPK